MVSAKYDVETVTANYFGDTSADDEVLSSPTLLVTAAKTVLRGNDGDDDASAALRAARTVLSRHPAAVREAVARRAFPVLAAFALASAAVFGLACAALHEPAFSGWTARATRAVYGCWPDRDPPLTFHHGDGATTVEEDACYSAWHGVRDTAVLLLGGVALLAFLGFPVNAVVAVSVWRGEYEPDLWWMWTVLHSAAAMGLFLTLFLSPFGVLVYWTMQNVKMYAVTFGDSVPCTSRARFM